MRFKSVLVKPSWFFSASGYGFYAGVIFSLLGLVVLNSANKQNEDYHYAGKHTHVQAKIISATRDYERRLQRTETLIEFNPTNKIKCQIYIHMDEDDFDGIGSLIWIVPRGDNCVNPIKNLKKPIFLWITAVFLILIGTALFKRSFEHRDDRLS